MFYYYYYYYYIINNNNNNNNNELLCIQMWASSVTFLIIVGWPPYFVGVKPEVYVPAYQGYVPWVGLYDGKPGDPLSLLHKP